MQLSTFPSCEVVGNSCLILNVPSLLGSCFFSGGLLMSMVTCVCPSGGLIHVALLCCSLIASLIQLIVYHRVSPIVGLGILLVFLLAFRRLWLIGRTGLLVRSFFLLFLLWFSSFHSLYFVVVAAV